MEWAPAYFILQTEVKIVNNATTTKTDLHSASLRPIVIVAIISGLVLVSTVFVVVGMRKPELVGGIALAFVIIATVGLFLAAVFYPKKTPAPEK